MPISPVTLYLEHKQIPNTEENVRIVKREWGLDEPVTVQYGKWMGHFLRGDWGRSYLSKLDVREEMTRRMPYSLAVGMGGVVLSGILSFVAGFLASMKEGGFWDRFTRVVTVLTQSIPSFILAIVVIYVIGVKYKLVKIFTGSALPGVLIATCLVALYQFGSLSRIVCRHFRNTLEKTYIKAYITRGFSLPRILWRYGYHDSLYGLLAAMVAKFSWVLGGTAVVEFIFTIPGVSGFLVDSVAARDYTVIQSYIMVITLWMFFVHGIFNLWMRYLRKGKGHENI